MSETPDHRTGFATRSGDTHVIGEDGLLQNIDQALRDAADAAPQGDLDEGAALRQAQDERVDEAKAERKVRPAAAADSAKAE